MNQRSEAADCMSLEATWRVRDPVYGCVGIISQLQQQIIMVQRELSKTQGEIAFHNANTLQHQQPQQMSGIGTLITQLGQPSTTNFNPNQQQHILNNNFDQQPLLDFYHQSNYYFNSQGRRTG